MVNVSRETLLNKFNISNEEISNINLFINILKESLNYHQFISRNDINKVWDRHILDSIMMMFHVKHFKLKKIVDLGSGAGFPGIILGIINNKLQVTLIERKKKRCDFLNKIITELKLENIKLICKDSNECKKKFNNIILRAVVDFDSIKKTINPILFKKGLFFNYQNIIKKPIGFKIVNKIEYILPNEKEKRIIVAYSLL